MNQKMRQCLLDANINPYSIEGRADIYCRFILEYPDKTKVQQKDDINFSKCHIADTKMTTLFSIFFIFLFRILSFHITIKNWTMEKKENTLLKRKMFISSTIFY